MNLIRYLTVFITLMGLVLLVGCSGKGSPVSVLEGQSKSIDIPILGIQQFDDSFTALGLMGAYELIIDKENTSGELISKRNLSLGESFLVNGVSFFTMTPCSDCLNILSVELTDEHYIRLNLSISHPFDEGDPFLPPTAMNRSDLNVFDLAVIIYPKESTPEYFYLTGVSVYSDFAVNHAGYTKELQFVTGDNSAVPFFLVVDDSETGMGTWNMFAQGSEAGFPVILDLENESLVFDLYLTMGYGASATKPTRLNPIYFNSEFNRKSAWKVDIDVSDDLYSHDSTGTVDITVRVFDWQIGAVVNENLENPNEIYAESGVSSVSVEVPGMFHSLKVSTTPDDFATGMPDDPLVYTFEVANENLLEEGTYAGLVKVTDERVPQSNPLPGQTDSLVDVPDGVHMTYMMIPEYVTYQTFAIVVRESTTANLWQTSQGSIANTGHKEGFNGPSGIFSDPSWTSDYIINNGDPQPVFLNVTTAFISASGTSGTYLPAVAVDLSNGSTKWTQAFGTEPGDWLMIKGISEDGSVVIANQRIASTETYTIYGLDAEDGSELWSIPGEIGDYTYPTLDMNGNFIVPVRNAGYRSIRPLSGSINWEHSYGDPHYCTPAVRSDNLIIAWVGSSYAQMIALYGANGYEKWTMETMYTYVGNTTNGITLHPNGNIIIHSDIGLYMLNDGGSGPGLVWYRNYPNTRHSSASVGPDDMIYLIDGSGELRRIDPVDGETVNSSSGWGNGDYSRLAISDNGLIYGSIGDGRFVCFNTDLSMRWDYQGAMTTPFGDPAIGGNGTVFSAKRELGLAVWRD